MVIPNYSELTGYIVSEVQKTYPAIKFIGSDGWGEDSFSFLQGYGLHKNTSGIAIRAGANKEDKGNYYNVYSLDREINDTIITPPYSIYSLVELIRTLSDDLCNSKAKNKIERKLLDSQLGPLASPLGSCEVRVSCHF